MHTHITLLIPEPYGGEAGARGEWVDHFESVATINKWTTGEEKLKWLRVRLTGKPQTAFKKLPQDVKENYGECIKSLQRRFDPDSTSMDIRVKGLETNPINTNQQVHSWQFQYPGLYRIND